MTHRTEKKQQNEYKT